MLRVDGSVRRAGLRSRIILQFRDERLLELPGEADDQVMELLEREMTHAADFAVPLEVDVNCGDYWYTAH